MKEKKQLTKREKITIAIAGSLIILTIAFAFYKQAAPAKSQNNELPSDAELSMKLDEDKPQEIPKGKEHPLFYNGEESEFYDQLDPDKPTMITFGGDWCEYCKKMQPILKEVHEEYSDRVNIVYVDADRYPMITLEYPAEASPSTMVMDKDLNPIDVTEEVYSKFGIDGYSKTEDGVVEASGFYGMKQKDELSKIIDDLLLKKGK